MKKIILILLIFTQNLTSQTFKERIFLKKGVIEEAILNIDLKITQINQYNVPFYGLEELSESQINQYANESNLISSVKYDPETGKKDGEFFDKNNKGYYKQGELTICNECEIENYKNLVNCNQCKIIYNSYFEDSDLIIEGSIINRIYVGKVDVYHKSPRYRTVEMSAQNQKEIIAQYAAGNLALGSGWMYESEFDGYKTVKVGEMNFNQNGMLEGIQTFLNEGREPYSDRTVKRFKGTRMEGEVTNIPIQLRIENWEIFSFKSISDSLGYGQEVVKINNKFKFLSKITTPDTNKLNEKYSLLLKTLNFDSGLSEISFSVFITRAKAAKEAEKAIAIENFIKTPEIQKIMFELTKKTTYPWENLPVTMKELIFKNKNDFLNGKYDTFYLEYLNETSAYLFWGNSEGPDLEKSFVIDLSPDISKSFREIQILEQERVIEEERLEMIKNYKEMTNGIDLIFDSSLRSKMNSYTYQKYNKFSKAIDIIKDKFYSKSRYKKANKKFGNWLLKQIFDYNNKEASDFIIKKYGSEEIDYIDDFEILECQKILFQLGFEPSKYSDKELDNDIKN